MADQDILVQFGIRVRELRKKQGISQEKLALDAGLERSYISDLERGKRNVALRNVYVLATTLGVTLAAFFEGIE